jgi:hypothetical protein
MKKTVLLLSALAIIASSCGQATKKQAETKTEDASQITVDALSGDKQDETLKDIHNIPFSEDDIACSYGYGLYGKFPLKQKWTTISFSCNQIITAETKQNYYDDDWKNWQTSLAEQGKELKLRFDIAFKDIYSEKDIEILPLTIENDDDIKKLIKQNIPVDISVKEFWKKHNPEYEMRPFEITNIQPCSFTNNENKLWIAYCKIRFEGYEYEELGLVGVTANKEVILLSGYCVYEEGSVYLLRLKDEFLLYVKNDTCGEGAIVTTRLYRLTANFEKFFEETVVYD